MKYLLLVSSLVSLLGMVSSTTASYGNSTILTSTSHKTASSSMTINPSSAKSSTSIISSTIVAPTTADVSTDSQGVTSLQTTTSRQISTPIVPTASPSTPIVPSPSKSSARPSTSVPHTTTTTPKPPPTPVEFDYKNKTNNVTCVAVKGTILLIVMIGRESYSVPVHGNATGLKGSCKTANRTTSSIYASWKSYMIGMEFAFLKDNSWFLHKIEAEVYDLGKYGNVSASSTFTSRGEDGLYQGSAKQSYTCTVEKKLVLSIGKGNGNITVDFQDLKIQPFPVTGPKFPNPKSCSNDTGSEPGNSIVPIAVGCALAGLIVIVLIAYLIGRRKSNKGYQQV